MINRGEKKEKMKKTTNKQKKLIHKKQLLFKKPPKIKFLCSLESNSDALHPIPILRIA